MPRLAGKVAFITGAGTGIGRATAILFAREGAKVAIADIDGTAGEETAQLAGNEAIAILTDVTDPDSLQAAIRATVDKFGRLDVLHNNAGGSTAQDETAVNAPLEEFWRAIKLDLFGTFLGCRFGIPELIKGGGGAVINMSSNVALMGAAGRDCYTAAKGGIAAITRSLAVAYAPQKVRVNAIAPSATMTDRVRRLIAGNAALTRLADWPPHQTRARRFVRLPIRPPRLTIARGGRGRPGTQICDVAIPWFLGAPRRRQT